MTQAQLDQEALSQTSGDEQRDLVPDMVLESEFVPPRVTSFALDGLDMDSVSALTPNGF